MPGSSMHAWPPRGHGTADAVRDPNHTSVSTALLSNLLQVLSALCGPQGAQAIMPGRQHACLASCMLVPL
jgi:hypothetical protein